MGAQLPYEILSRKRAGERLTEPALRAAVAGAASGTWSDAQLGAFLMAAAIRGLDGDETRTLTLAMLESGERWQLAREVPLLCDKHSTGGVGDKVSLPLAPLLAVCGLPVVMLTGRALGHTGGTADKLEAIPGLELGLDRDATLRLLRDTGIAIGIATGSIAPADRRLYALRDQTATVSSLPLITASILSKKLATGAGALVLDVKAGSGAFLPELAEARQLAALLVATANALGVPTSAWLTDMSQPLGRWVGHACEVQETLELLQGEGPGDLQELTFALATEVAALHGVALEPQRLAEAIASGAARETFLRWARAQGAAAAWTASPRLPLAEEEHVVTSSQAGWLAAVDCRALGLLLIEAGAGRARPGAAIDPAVSLRYEGRLGQRVERGEPLARLYLRRRDDGLAAALGECFTVAPEPKQAPPLLYERIA
ncbi:MAG TPA: thymidine phosphorylase [Thermoanaerobaculia bacterium]|jgi:pyrimidine-nucleoside phosphorylase|nr:thymidine phosphorylase [Thermoanaerobaculia bacterium]